MPSGASPRSPGLGVESAQQIIAEVGVTAATFPSARQLASWAGVCPGHEESAGINYNPRCPKGNRQMRRVLNQAANAAARGKGTIFAVLYRRLVARLGHAQAIGAIAHRLCRLAWKILHERVRYEERGPAVDAQAARIRTRKMIRALRGPPTSGDPSAARTAQPPRPAPRCRGCAARTTSRAWTLPSLAGVFRHFRLTCTEEV